MGKTIITLGILLLVGGLVAAKGTVGSPQRIEEIELRKLIAPTAPVQSWVDRAKSRTQVEFALSQTQRVVRGAIPRAEELGPIRIAALIQSHRALQHGLTNETHARRLANAIVAGASLYENVSPELLAATSWVESRHLPVIGDRGQSCGPFQQQARYSPGYHDFWVRSGARNPPRQFCGEPVLYTREEECTRLLTNLEYGACVAAYQLSRWRPCQYNAGPNRCRFGLEYEEKVFLAMEYYR